MTPVLIGLAICGCLGRPAAPGPQIGRTALAHGTDAAPRGAAGGFTYLGEPIHPFIVRTADGLVSDDVPIKVNIDLALYYGSGKYTAAVEADGPTATARDPRRKSWFQYRWLGALDDGTHVLRTTDCPVGTGEFVSVMFVQLRTAKASSADGTPDDKAFMTVLRWYPLGDRDDAKIELQRDRVIVHPSKHRKEPMVLALPLSGEAPPSRPGQPHRPATHE